MRPILFLLPDLGYHGHARQASIVATALSGDRYAPSVFSLGGPGPFAEPLRQAGIPVHGKAAKRRLDLSVWFSLRKLLAEKRPSLLHVWGTRALRLLLWASLGKRSLLPPLVVSLSFTVLKKKQLAWRDRRLIDRVRAIVVMSEAERIAFVDAGLPKEKLRVIRPGVSPPGSIPDAALFRNAQGIPSQSPLLMGVGHLETADRFIDAVWAFEMLKFVDPALHLVIVGDGPNRHWLAKKFESARDSASGLHFHGARASAAELVGLADVVLVPHRRTGGTYATLEAMAAGRPVVAANLPHLAEIIRDGENGFLVPPDDQPAIARAVLRLLENSELRLRIGAAARASVEKEHRTETMAERFLEVYDEVLRH